MKYKKQTTAGISSSDQDMESSDTDFDDEKNLFNSAKNTKIVENCNSDNEVMGFDSNEEDEVDSMVSDIENLEDNYDIPNEKAWGKNKKAYYSSNYVDSNYATISQKEVADAELEEEEAKNLQKHLAKQLDEADFGFELILPKDNNYKLSKDNEKIRPDLNKISKRQKKEFLSKENPEFILLFTDFKEKLFEAKSVLEPFLNVVKNFNSQDSSGARFLKAKLNLILHYCTNVSFYLILKSKMESTTSHNVIKRLAQYRHLLAQLDDNQKNIMKKVKKILKTVNSEQCLLSSKLPSIGVTAEDQSQPKQSMQVNENENKVLVYENDSDKDLDINYENHLNNEDSNIQREKRAITHQISKNKGLTPYRKKEQRNPRVKHKNKYRKAKIRRKGAVREVRKEITRYGGEISGIKASVSKSIKLK